MPGGQVGRACDLYPLAPQVYRNATMLAVPLREGPETARERIRDYLGREEVRSEVR